MRIVFMGTPDFAVPTLEQGGTATLAGVKAVGGPVWRFSPQPPRAEAPPPPFGRS